MKELEQYVTAVPDFPHKGIIFRDITTITKDNRGFRLAIDGLLDCLKDVEYDLIAGPDSRGFLFGAPLAYAANKGFIMFRKPGKLPREVFSQEYELEYGKTSIEVHTDSIKPGDRVVIVDDLIATGGTIKAVADLIEKMSGTVVKIIVILELKGLEGRRMLAKYDVESLIAYDGI